MTRIIITDYWHIIAISITMFDNVSTDLITVIESNTKDSSDNEFSSTSDDDVVAVGKIFIIFHF